MSWGRSRFLRRIRRAVHRQQVGELAYFVLTNKDLFNHICWLQRQEPGWVPYKNLGVHTMIKMGLDPAQHPRIKWNIRESPDLLRTAALAGNGRALLHLHDQMASALEPYQPRVWQRRAETACYDCHRINMMKLALHLDFDTIRALYFKCDALDADIDPRKLCGAWAMHFRYATRTNSQHEYEMLNASPGNITTMHSKLIDVILGANNPPFKFKDVKRYLPLIMDRQKIEISVFADYKVVMELIQYVAEEDPSKEVILMPEAITSLVGIPDLHKLRIMNQCHYYSYLSDDYLTAAIRTDCVVIVRVFLNSLFINFILEPRFVRCIKSYQMAKEVHSPTIASIDYEEAICHREVYDWYMEIYHAGHCRIQGDPVRPIQFGYHKHVTEVTDDMLYTAVEYGQLESLQYLIDIKGGDDIPAVGLVDRAIDLMEDCCGQGCPDGVSHIPHSRIVDCFEYLAKKYPEVVRSAIKTNIKIKYLADAEGGLRPTT